jgi:hypothetical protein
MNIEGIEFTDNELAVLQTQCGVSGQNISRMLPQSRSQLKTAIEQHITNIANDDTWSRIYLHSVVDEIRAERRV